MYPHERSLIEQLSGEPFALIGVNSDSDRDEIKRIRAEKNLNWRNFWDGSNGPIATKWNIRAWPTVLVIDANGVIRHKGKDVDAVIEKCLAEIGSDVKIVADHQNSRR